MHFIEREDCVCDRLYLIIIIIKVSVRDKVTRHCPHTTTFEEQGEPKLIRTEVPLLTSLTARPKRLTHRQVLWKHGLLGPGWLLMRAGFFQTDQQPPVEEAHLLPVQN